MWTTAECPFDGDHSRLAIHIGDHIIEKQKVRPTYKLAEHGMNIGENGRIRSERQAVAP